MGLEVLLWDLKKGRNFIFNVIPILFEFVRRMFYFC